MAPDEAESILETYDSLLNSFHCKVIWFIPQLERIEDKIGKYEVPVLSNQTYFKEKIQPK